MEERRSSERLAAHYRVSITVLTPDDESSDTKTFFGSTDDISSGGLRFHGDTEFPEGEVLDLLVVLGWSYWGFPFKGRVAWVQRHPTPPDFTIGIQFVDVPAPAQSAWDEALEGKLPRSRQTLVDA
jgi:hypothetical protein